MKFNVALQNWLALSRTGRKPSTQKYLAEIAGIIGKNWPEPEIELDAVTETHLASFVPLVAHYSAPRFNAVVSALKRIAPVAARNVRRATVRCRQRSNLSQLEFSRILVELDSRPRSWAGLVVSFLAHTGLRINEARQLRWCDVTCQGILLPGQFSKNGHPRFIPLVNGIADVLNRLRAIGDGNHVLPQASVKKALARACGVVGVPHLSHHDFRHLFATRCIESGVDLPTAARWLGHRDGGALLGRVYFHLADAHSREMGRRVKI